MVVQAGARRTLETLSPRPPTPPRESEITEPRPRLLSRILSMGLGSQTPPNVSPKSAAESLDTPSDRSHKKVGWSIVGDSSAFPEALNSNGSNSTRHLKQEIRPLLPSSDQKPPKSILKPYHGSIPLNQTPSLDNSAQPHTHASFAIMLESVVKQLAGADRMSKLDAYMSLSSVLKATDNIPDPKALKDKTGLLAQFIQRDMTVKLPSGTFDAVLINNALILLASLLWKAESLPNDFCAFILDHTIATIEDPKVSKDVAKHLMFVIGQQNFSSKIMTPDRAARLLKAAHEIMEHVKGKSIVLGRLGIYRKLLKQAKPSMIANNDWLRDMFEDTLISVKDIRSSAISFGLEAGLVLGTQSKVSRAVVELFQEPHENGKYADYFASRLNAMIQARQDAACVPQIWSVVTLFLRSRPAQLEQWEFMNPWFQILQKCFNNSDPDVKSQANFAWNRLVFAIRPDEKTSPRLIKMLHQPFIGQLNRKTNGRQSKEMFQVTINSICNLLYYTMKPNASPAQLELYWDSHLIPLITKLSTASGEQGLKKGTQGMDGAGHAIEILRSLLDSSTKSPTKLWKQDRAMIPDLMRTEELPSIDPKWVRKNCERVLNVIEPLLEQRFVDLGKAQSTAKDLWRSFLLSVGAAGAKEIKVSIETMACVAKIFTLLRRFWQKGPQSSEQDEAASDPAEFIDSFVYLITESVSVLGILPFTEKKLSINDENNFAAVGTPSSHSGRLPKTIRSPIQYLVVLLVEAAANIQCSVTYKAAIRNILNPFYEARTSRASRIDFCQDLVQCLPTPSPNSDASSSATVWCVLADMLAQAISETEDGNSHTPSSSGVNKQQQVETLRNIVRVLEYGLTTIYSEAISHWEALFRAASRCIRSEVGDGGHALCLIDPLARCLRDQQGRTDIHALAKLCAMIVSDASYPVDAHSLEAARRKLWDSSTSAPKQLTTDPYKYLYSTVAIYLEKCYEVYDQSAVDADELLSGVTVLIERCPGANLLALFSEVGSGAACWIQDPNLAVTSGSALSKVVATLWETICSKASTTIPKMDSAALSKFQTLLNAGLSSKHKSIANSSINLWNRTFGMQSGLEYPAEAAKALARLRFVAELKLPNFPATFDDDDAPNLPHFADSDEDDEQLLRRLNGGVRSRGITPFSESSPVSSHRKSRSPYPAVELSKSASKKRMLDEARTKLRAKSKRDTTPRLRHDDSQIQFAAIESSPAAEAADSQLLTDRQREVRERQQLEASTMFPDLRSSPRRKEKKSSSKLSLSSDLPHSTASEQKQQGTPSVNHATSTFDDFITSSPTPQRESCEARHGVDLIASDSEAIDLPSSPPKKASPRPSSVETNVAEAAEQNGPSASDEFWNVTSFGSIDSLMLGRSNGGDLLELFQAAKETRRAEDSDSDVESSFAQKLPEREGPSSPVQQHLDDDKSTFVDAPSSLNGAHERDELTADEVFVDAQSSPRRDPQSADLSSAHGSTRRKRRRRNRREAVAETAQNVRATRSRGTSASSTTGMDGDTTVPLTESSDAAPAEPEIDVEISDGETGEDEKSTTKISVGVRSSEEFVPESYLHVPKSPERETRKSKKRRRAAAASPELQPTPIASSRPERSTRSSDRRNSSVPTASEEPVVPDTIPSRTRSHSRKRTLASSTIPETPSSARSATSEKGRRRESPHSEDGHDDYQPQPQLEPQPAKRRRVSRAESRAIVEDSQDVQRDVANEDSIVVTPQKRRSKRDKTPSLTWDEKVAALEKSGRRKSSRNSTVWKEQVGSLSSVDLDEFVKSYFGDGFMDEEEVKGEERKEQDDQDMRETGQQAEESQEVTHADTGSAADAEAEAQIMEGISEANRSLRRRTRRSRDADRSFTSMAVVDATDVPDAAADSDAVTTTEFTGASAVSQFAALVAGLKTTTISRADAMKMEEMVWDFKAELYAAERRGRSA